MGGGGREGDAGKFTVDETVHVSCTFLPASLRLQSVVVTVLPRQLVLLSKIFSCESHGELDIGVRQTLPQTVFQLQQKREKPFKVNKAAVATAPSLE